MNQIEALFCVSGSRGRHRLRRWLLLATLLVVPGLLAGTAAAQPTFTKSFSPTTIGPGSVATLTFTIDNTGSGAPVDMMAFTDVLPAGVTLATPASPVSSCGGTLSAPDGGGTVTFTDGLVGAFGACTVDVNVTSGTTGTHMNVSGDLTSSAGNSGPASADLTVATDRPGFSKSFSPSSVPLGSRSRLTFTIDNSANASLMTFLVFTDVLPVGLEIADPANASNTCATGGFTGGVLTAVPGTGVVSLSLGGGVNAAAVAAGGTCTVSVDVVATGLGSLGNTSGELTSTTGIGPFLSSGKAGAVLDVTADDVTLIKEFTDDPVPPGGTVTLEFTLLNFNRTETATDISFVDNLGDAGGTLAGLAAVGPLPTNPCGPGSSLTGTTTLSLTGGSLLGEQSCTFSVTLQVPVGATPGIYPNTTSSVGFFIPTVGEPTFGNQASDDLFVFAAPLLVKTFLDDPVAAGDTTRLELTVTNTSPTSPATNIAFIDELDVILPTASAVPGNGCCGAGSVCTFTPLINPPPPSSVVPARLTVSGGSLAAGASCTFEITLDVASTASSGLYPNTTSDITATVDATTVTGNPATADLEVVGGPILNKEFTDDPVVPGDTVTLQFTLVHDGAASSDATAISFTDDLDATLTGLVAVGLPMNDVCGAGSQISGTDTLSFTGGSLTPGSSCQFAVTLQVPMAALANTYPNTTSVVDATVSGLAATTPAAADDLVVAGLSLAKEFTDDPVIPGGSATLQFTIVNQVGAPAASSISFQDDLASVAPGLTFAPGSVPVTPCGVGSSITLLSANTLLTFQGGSLGPGEMCQFSLTIDVGAGVASGVYPNLTIDFSALIDGSLLFLGNAADALIVAGDVLLLTKTFLTNPVGPGAVVDLEFELTNLSLAGTATGITFTDDLSAALTGLQAITLPPNGFCGAASQLTGAGLLTLTGGELGPGASCTFAATLQLPAMPAASQAINTTSQVTGTVGGLGVTGTPATDTLVIQNVDFTKSFSGPAAEGGTVVLAFTVDNLTANPVAALGFTDDLNAVLPGLVATGLPLVNPCGSGSLLSGTGLLTLTGGSLAGNASCSFNVTLQVPAGAAAGGFLNATSDLFSSGLPVAAPATDTLQVEPPPLFSKSFAPNPIVAGGVSTLTFTVDNGASQLSATNLLFSDTLPAAVVVASPPNESNTCTGGTLTVVAGSGSITYTGGTVAAGNSCTITVDTTSDVPGAHVNTTSDLVSSSGNSGPASDTLTVSAPPAPLFSKAFAPNVVGVGVPSTLVFTIDNSASLVEATSLGFVDNLPAGLTVLNPPSASATCTGGTIAAVAGSGTVSYTGGSVAAGATCTLQVDVVASTTGLLTNTSGDLTSSSGNSGAANDTLNVSDGPLFTKVFTPSAITAGGVSTLIFTIDNSGGTGDADGLDFVDNLPAGVLVATPANGSTTCSGGTLGAVAGSGVISYTGGTVAAGTSCTVQADVQAALPGAYVNTTSDLVSSLGTSAPASDTLDVPGSPLFSKAFAPNPVAGGSVALLTFTIDNSASPLPAINLDFVDNLPAGMLVATPANGSTTCSGGTLTAVAGSGVISYTGGTVAAGGSCTVQADVQAALPGAYVNTTSDLVSSLGTSAPASDTLDVSGSPLFSKAFAPNPVLLGSVALLTFTIDNSASPLPATNLDFVDNLPAGMLVATPANASTTCSGGTLTAVEGSGVISYSGGTVAAGTSCTVQADVLVDAAGTFVNTSGDLTSSLGGSGAAIEALVVSETVQIPTLDRWMLSLFGLFLVWVAVRRLMV